MPLLSLCNFINILHLHTCYFRYLQAFLPLSALYDRQELLQPAAPGPGDPDHQGHCRSLRPYEELVERLFMLIFKHKQNNYK